MNRPNSAHAQQYKKLETNITRIAS
jgi:hypothetical protein